MIERSKRSKRFKRFKFKNKIKKDIKMEKLIVLGIMVVAVVWYFKSKKNKSKNVKDTIQEEFTETCCSKSSEIKEEIKEEDKVEVSLEKYPAELAENLKISNLEVIIINLPSIIEAKAPVDCTLENLKELAKDIFSKQVEPLSYATIYKYIADHYGYRTWKDFKKILESK
jgi:hypothetical protein